MIKREIPIPSPEQDTFWGSDAIAQCLRKMDIPFLALNPGASYRGLHDSLVNHLGNESPQMLLCLHEEVAISIAQGYAKASGKMMGAVVHSNVGLMHATMAIFNAWCDRSPMLILGATGPWDAAKRRPWIDWIHTAADQGALVRDYTKWDNQPGSVSAAIESLLRGSQIAQTAPRGPVYVNLDAALQEAQLQDAPTLPDVSRYLPPKSSLANPTDIEKSLSLLNEAKKITLLFGRMSRSKDDWDRRVKLAEKLNAEVVTDLKNSAVFPTHHPQHTSSPGYFMSPDACKAVREAELVVLFDWVDPGGAFKQALQGAPLKAKVIHVSLDMHIHRGWSMDMGSLPAADVFMLCEPDDAVLAFLSGSNEKPKSTWPTRSSLPLAPTDDVVSLRAIADVLQTMKRSEDLCIARLPLGWNGAYLNWTHPLDYLGADGGGGIGAGPGNAIGVGLALKEMDSKRIPMALIGDGDFLMGNTAVWTAVRYAIPMLIVVCNNHSFFNDELHQERVAKERSRPVENKWIGQRISEPEIDIAQMSSSMGAKSLGPIKRKQDLQAAFEQALIWIKAGHTCIIDACVAPGYDANMSGQTVTNSTAHQR